MNWLTIVLRLVHVVGGVLWVGFAVFGAFYLVPSIAETGPEGGKVMARPCRGGVADRHAAAHRRGRRDGDRALCVVDRDQQLTRSPRAWRSLCRRDIF